MNQYLAFLVLVLGVWVVPLLAPLLGYLVIEATLGAETFWHRLAVFAPCLVATLWCFSLWQKSLAQYMAGSAVTNSLKNLLDKASKPEHEGRPFPPPLCGKMQS